MDETIDSQEDHKALASTDAGDMVPGSSHLLADIRSLIETTRGRLAQAVNTELANLYWSIGNRIRQDIIGEGRAEYGQQIVLTLSRKLAAEYGRGFGQPQRFPHDPVCRGLSEARDSADTFCTIVLIAIPRFLPFRVSVIALPSLSTFLTFALSR